jgi:hypothetical protein
MGLAVINVFFLQAVSGFFSFRVRLFVKKSSTVTVFISCLLKRNRKALLYLQSLFACDGGTVGKLVSVRYNPSAQGVPVAKFSRFAYLTGVTSAMLRINCTFRLSLVFSAPLWSLSKV